MQDTALTTVNIGATTALNVDGSTYTGLGGPFVLFDTGSASGFSSGQAQFTPGDVSITGFASGASLDCSTPGEILLNVTAVPEPSSAMLLGAAALGGLLIRRRRTA